MELSLARLSTGFANELYLSAKEDSDLATFIFARKCKAADKTWSPLIDDLFELE